MYSGSRCTSILWLFMFWHCGQSGNNDQTDYSLHAACTHWLGPNLISRQAQNVQRFPLYTDLVIVFLALRTEWKHWPKRLFTTWRLHSLSKARLNLGRVKMCSGSRCTPICNYFCRSGQNGSNDQTHHALHDGFTHWPGLRVISRQGFELGYKWRQ